MLGAFMALAFYLQVFSSPLSDRAGCLADEGEGSAEALAGGSGGEGYQLVAEEPEAAPVAF